MTTKKKPKAVQSSKSQTVQLLEELAGGPLTFARALIASRNRAALSQVELGARIGVSRAYICDLEKGRRGVSPGRAEELARALGSSEVVLIRLAIQDSLNRDGIKMTVKLELGAA